MNAINLDSRVKKLFENLKAGKTKVDLKTGETLYLSKNDMLELFAEATQYFSVIDNDGKEIQQDKTEMSEGLQQMALAYRGQNKAIDFLKEVAKK